MGGRGSAVRTMALLYGLFDRPSAKVKHVAVCWHRVQTTFCSCMARFPLPFAGYLLRQPGDPVVSFCEGWFSGLFCKVARANLCLIAGNPRCPICVSQPVMIPLFQESEPIRTICHVSLSELTFLWLPQPVSNRRPVVTCRPIESITDHIFSFADGEPCGGAFLPKAG